MKKTLIEILIFIGFLFVVGAVMVGSQALQEGIFVPKLPTPPLHELATAQGITLGNYAARDRLDEKPYRDILVQQFELITVDGHLNWHFEDATMRPGPDQYDFSAPDEVVAFAQRHNKPIQGHHFVWGEEKWLPEWLKNGNYSKEQLLSFMEQHIKTVGAHYKGKIREWTVVNEAFTRGLHEQGLSDWWADNIGSQEYIEKAFYWAREADPNAVLILNDFRNDTSNRVSDAMYEWIRSAKARGVPIDAIGMQMHIDGTRPAQRDEVIKNMQRFSALGVKVYVTEFDVNMNDLQASDEEKRTRQAIIYHEMLRACIESKVCPSFAYLGITDKESWYNELGLPNAMPLIFDKAYRPKPAFWGIRQALEY